MGLIGYGMQLNVYFLLQFLW